MQIPLWFFVLSIALALSWQNMASLLLKRSSPLLTSHIKSYLPSSFPSLNHISNLQQSYRPFTNTPTNATMSPSTPFLETIAARRSIYALSKSSPIPDSKIQEIIKEAILHVPSSFNSQSTRAILLVKEEHDKLWDIAKTVLKGIVPEDQWAGTEGRLNGFQAAYGTVSFPFNSFPNPHLYKSKKQNTDMVDANRYCSSPPAPPCNPCKKNSPSTPTASHRGRFRVTA